MAFCRLVEFLVNVVPLRSLQDCLVRRHVQKCPCCAERLVSREEARLSLSGERDVAEDPDFVRKVVARAARSEPSADIAGFGARRFVRWAAAAAGLVLVVGATLWFVLGRGGGPGQTGPGPGEGDTFRINFLNVDGAPAETMLIQPRDSDMVIIWVDRNLGSPDRNGEPGGRP
jgi:hypothetical protein